MYFGIAKRSYECKGKSLKPTASGFRFLFKETFGKNGKSQFNHIQCQSRGGYQLARSAQDITVFDAFSALDQDKEVLQFQHLSDHIFPDKEHTRMSEKKIEAAFEKGLNELYDELKKVKIADLL